MRRHLKLHATVDMTPARQLVTLYALRLLPVCSATLAESGFTWVGAEAIMYITAELARLARYRERCNA